MSDRAKFFFSFFFNFSKKKFCFLIDKRGKSGSEVRRIKSTWSESLKYTAKKVLDTSVHTFQPVFLSYNLSITTNMKEFPSKTAKMSIFLYTLTNQSEFGIFAAHLGLSDHVELFLETSYPISPRLSTQEKSFVKNFFTKNFSIFFCRLSTFVFLKWC